MQVTILRIGGEYRRCCWYLLVGSGLIVGIALMLRGQSLPPPDCGGLTFVALLAVPLFFLLLLVTAESWRLRIDQAGISRRRWWRWSTWPWEAIRDGRIYRDLGSGRYIFPGHGMGNRQLLLDLLSEDDREYVDNLCRLALRSAGETPSVAPVEILAQGRGQRLTRTGLCLSPSWKQYQEPLTAWSDVEILRLRWERRHDRLVCHVKLKTKHAPPINTVLMRLAAIMPSGQEKPLTNEVEQLERFLAPLLRPKRFVSYQAFDPPRDTTEATHQVAYFQRRIRFARRFFLVINLLGIVASAGLVVGKIIPGGKVLLADPFLPLGWKVAILSCGLLIALSYPAMFAGFAWFTLARLTKRLARAKAFSGQS